MYPYLMGVVPDVHPSRWGSYKRCVHPTRDPPELHQSLWGSHQCGINTCKAVRELYPHLKRSHHCCAHPNEGLSKRASIPIWALSGLHPLYQEGFSKFAPALSGEGGGKGEGKAQWNEDAMYEE